MGRPLHNAATSFVWLRLLGLFVMFVMVFLTIVLTGGIGWFLFETDSQNFADIIGAPPEGQRNYDPELYTNFDGGSGFLMGNSLTGDSKKGKYDDESWFQPMCTDKCANLGLNPGKRCAVNFGDFEYDKHKGCSFLKDWSECTNKAQPDCRNMCSIVTPQWKRNEKN